jgi:hypothetical protein
MGFEFDLGDLSEVDWGADEYVVEFTIGFDIESEERVSMAVALIEDKEGGADPFALTFGVMTRGINGGQSRGPLFDHAACRRYVSRENAPAVMKLILEAIRKLVDEVNPQAIAMATYEEALPPQAMAKYYNITNMLGQCGFGMTSYSREGTDQKDY